MPKLKKGTIVPTDEEDAVITAAAAADPDATPLTDDEWARVKPRGRGRPKADITKEQVTVRLDQDVLDAFRATGNGWQTRVNNVLKKAVKRKEHLQGSGPA